MTRRTNPRRNPLHGALAGAAFGVLWPYVSALVVPEDGPLPQKAILRSTGLVVGAGALGAYFGGPSGAALGVGASLVTSATVTQFRAGNRDPLGGVRALGGAVASLAGAPVQTVATLPPDSGGGGMVVPAPVAAPPPEVAYGRRRWPKVESRA